MTVLNLEITVIFIIQWSITNFLKEKQISPYWASTSSNGLVNRLIRTASAEIKSMMETLLEGDSVEVSIDEQLVFEQLDNDENAIWSLLLASGYLKVDSLEKRGLTLEPWYHLSITNLENRKYVFKYVQRMV